ncbi:MAG: outer membrane protein transport protein [Bacteroidetes bacterium]|nr:outer membrane protein transport protein [Bacteroidota bacterium]
MNKLLLTTFTMLFFQMASAQVGHVLQHVGAVNTAMGGASTAQPLDITGTLQWNPAALSVFDGQIISVNAGLFFSDPNLSSTVPTPDGPFSGETGDDRGTSVLPSLAYVWGKKDSKHTFGVSAFGVAGFGVTFPQSDNNPITLPQSAGGFGRVESDYILLQVGFAYSYKISEKVSVGIQPTVNYASLKIEPNPLAAPDPQKGFPLADRADALGFGAQIGVFYDSGIGFKMGASYKTPQYFSNFDFNNSFLDGSPAPGVEFNLDYPAMYSVGLGYSNTLFDLALDFRYIDYENTNGFDDTGWVIAQEGDFAGFPTGAVKGFGWKSIGVVSAGIQFNGFDKLPLRAGYTFSDNPIDSKVAFLSTPATAIIQDAFQFGFGYQFTDRITLDAAYHHGSSRGKTKGPLLNPTPDVANGPWNAQTNPLGAIPGSEVGFDMTTDMIIFGLTYSLGK